MLKYLVLWSENYFYCNKAGGPGQWAIYFFYLNVHDFTYRNNIIKMFGKKTKPFKRNVVRTNLTLKEQSVLWTVSSSLLLKPSSSVQHFFSGKNNANLVCYSTLVKDLNLFSLQSIVKIRTTIAENNRPGVGIPTNFNCTSKRKNFGFYCKHECPF